MDANKIVDHMIYCENGLKTHDQNRPHDQNRAMAAPSKSTARSESCAQNQSASNDKTTSVQHDQNRPLDRTIKINRLTARPEQCKDPLDIRQGGSIRIARSKSTAVQHDQSNASRPT